MSLTPKKPSNISLCFKKLDSMSCSTPTEASLKKIRMLLPGLINLRKKIKLSNTDQGDGSHVISIPKYLTEDFQLYLQLLWPSR